MTMNNAESGMMMMLNNKTGIMVMMNHHYDTISKRTDMMMNTDKENGIILDPKTGTMVSPNLGKELMMNESGTMMMMMMMSPMDSKNSMTMNPMNMNNNTGGG